MEQNQQEQQQNLGQQDERPSEPDDDLEGNSDDDLVTYRHLTIDASADDIVRNGIKAVIGASSKNDPRFFAVTTERGRLPRPTESQVQDMLHFINLQLDHPTRHPGQPRKLVYIRIPARVVDKLERQRLIIYDLYLPAAKSGYDESIFATASFPIVNQFKHLWLAILYP